jgi:hypothetical protein
MVFFLLLTIRHEIAHLMGINDRYFDLRFIGLNTYPLFGWGDNLMGDAYNGTVEIRNFWSAMGNDRTNRIIRR